MLELETSPRRSRIWLVDDSPTEASAAAKVLGDRHDVTAFASGGVMLERWALMGERPDMIVTDHEMPDMTGVELCSFLRGSLDQVALPILLLTAHGAKADVVAGLRAGANDYVTKPYDPEELLARVQGLLRTRQLHDLAKQTSDFEQHLLGIVSHDLRNPITAILTTTETLLGRPDAAEIQHRGLKMILSSGTRANRMIRDLLDFTQARLGGGLRLDRRDCDLHEIVLAAAEEIRIAHPGREVRTSGSGWGTGFWDADRLYQMASNIVSNAAHFGRQGTPISVTTVVGATSAHFSVHNVGAPIPPNVRERLFDPLVRGPDHGSQRRSLGLGLYIVQQVVRAHQGTITVDSTEAEGTTVSVTLPLGPTPAAGATSSSI